MHLWASTHVIHDSAWLHMLASHHYYATLCISTLQELVLFEALPCKLPCTSESRRVVDKSSSSCLESRRDGRKLCMSSVISVSMHVIVGTKPRTAKHPAQDGTGATARFSWQRMHVCRSGCGWQRSRSAPAATEVPFQKGCPANCSKQEYSCHSPGRVAGEVSWRHVVVAVRRRSATLCFSASLQSEAGINWCRLEIRHFGCLHMWSLRRLFQSQTAQAPAFLALRSARLPRCCAHLQTEPMYLAEKELDPSHRWGGSSQTLRCRFPSPEITQHKIQVRQARFLRCVLTKLLGSKVGCNMASACMWYARCHSVTIRHLSGEPQLSAIKDKGCPISCEKHEQRGSIAEAV